MNYHYVGKYLGLVLVFVTNLLMGWYAPIQKGEIGNCIKVVFRKKDFYLIIPSGIKSKSICNLGDCMPRP